VALETIGDNSVVHAWAPDISCAVGAAVIS
jgi:hypothetical protein